MRFPPLVSIPRDFLKNTILCGFDFETANYTELKNLPLKEESFLFNKEIFCESDFLEYIPPLKFGNKIDAYIIDAEYLTLIVCDGETFIYFEICDDALSEFLEYDIVSLLNSPTIPEEKILVSN